MGQSGSKEQRLALLLESEMSKVEAERELFPTLDWHNEVCWPRWRASSDHARSRPRPSPSFVCAACVRASTRAQTRRWAFVHAFTLIRGSVGACRCAGEVGERQDPHAAQHAAQLYGEPRDQECATTAA